MACIANVYYLKKDSKEEEKVREMDDRALIRKGGYIKVEEGGGVDGFWRLFWVRQLNQRHQELQSDHQTHA